MPILTPTKQIKPALKEGLASWDLLERMFNNVNTLDYKNCWVWTNAISPQGYGVTTRKINNKLYGFLVHRVAYYFFYGALSENMVVDHTCHNPKTCVSGVECNHRRCYNPHHLRLVTRAENTTSGAVNNNQSGICRNKKHAWTEDNIIVYPYRRMCKSCLKERNIRRNKEKREAKNAR